MSGVGRRFTVWSGSCVVAWTERNRYVYVFVARVRFGAFVLFCVFVLFGKSREVEIWFGGSGIYVWR